MKHKSNFINFSYFLELYKSKGCIRLRQLLNNLFILKECKLGDASSTVYLLKTNSKDGLIIIDTGIGVNFKKKLNKIGLNPKNIKHCLITHSHIDHLQGCKNLMNINPDIRYYMHQKDVKPTEMVINKENNINFAGKKHYNQ